DRLHRPLQELVPGGMVTGVVYPLEVVEVEHDQAKRLAGTRGLVELRVEALFEAAAVEAASQRIGSRHAGKLLTAALLVRRVPGAEDCRAGQAEGHETDV